MLSSSFPYHATASALVLNTKMNLSGPPGSVFAGFPAIVMALNGHARETIHAVEPADAGGIAAESCGVDESLMR